MSFPLYNYATEMTFKIIIAMIVVQVTLIELFDNVQHKKDGTLLSTYITDLLKK